MSLQPCRSWLRTYWPYDGENLPEGYAECMTASLTSKASTPAPTPAEVRESLPDSGGDDAVRHSVTDMIAPQPVSTRRLKGQRLTITLLNFDRCSDASRAPSDTRGSAGHPAPRSRNVDTGAPDSFDSSRQLMTDVSSRSTTSQSIETSESSDRRTKGEDLVFMGDSVRRSVRRSQRGSVQTVSDVRPSVRDLRQNARMVRKRDRDHIEERRLKQPGIRLGERITYWREVRGFSIRELTKAAGLKGGTVGDLESGRSKKGLHLHEIAIALGVRYEYLKDGSGEPEPGPDDVVTIHAHDEPALLPPTLRSRLKALRLTRSESRLVELEMLALLDQIELDRRQMKRG